MLNKPPSVGSSTFRTLALNWHAFILSYFLDGLLAEAFRYPVAIGLYVLNKWSC